MYCNSITEDDTNFCTLKADKSGCEVNAKTGCTHGLPTAASWDSNTTASTYVPIYCSTKTDKLRATLCKANSGNTDCEAATCEDISPSTS